MMKQDQVIRKPHQKPSCPHTRPGLSPDQHKRIYQRHLRGAFARSGAVVVIWLFLIWAYFFHVIDKVSFIGITITGGMIIAVNVPFLWGLRHVFRRGVMEAYNLSINVAEAVGDTVIIYFLGGLRGMYLAMIYGVLIAYVGVVAPRRYSFIIATICGFSFSVMVLLEHFGVIPHQNNAWGYHYSLNDVILTISSLSITLYVMAFLISSASDLLKRTQQELTLQKDRLEASNEELSRAAEKLKQTNRELHASMEELSRAQTQLVEAEKMASLGSLVAGVAHEINTPIGVTITAASFLQEKTREFGRRMSAPPDAKSLETYIRQVTDSTSIIMHNLNQAVELVRNFKEVAVDQSTETRRKFNLKSYIDGTLLSMRFQFKRTGHRIEVVCPENLEIDSYPGMFSQIITNLMMNSLLHGFEGMNAGVIRIEISSADHKLRMRYSDNGRGMEPDTIKRIYEPFFTTRRGEGGTGLGMHIVYNIVTQTLGGSIRCTSAPGKGVAFDIDIPLAASGG